MLGLVLCLIMIAFPMMATAAESQENALEKFVREPSPDFSWKKVKQVKSGQFTVTTLTMTSQKWRGGKWTHDMIVVRPKTVRNSDIAFIRIAGSEGPQTHLNGLKLLAERAGAITAVIGDVPNQPLYDGKVEDSLIAYTFDQYVRTGDETWPLLFPMVKSATSGLDTIEAFAKKEFDQDVKRFVVAGASKRGWTTWLTAAVDKRVAGIAPMVFDMLNMKVQTQWSQKVYGKQSEQIHDYTDAELVQRLDHPAMQKLARWVDPYFYRDRYKMPKLLLLGTNDPYWTVDSVRHYWNDLPEPKLIYQTPNAGHDLGGGSEAINTLAAFFEMIAENAPLPTVKWTVEGKSEGKFHVTINQGARAARLWTATSEDRDFRDERWTDRQIKVQQGSARAEADLIAPANGYRGHLLEAELTSPGGHPYKISTEVKVLPDLRAN